MISSNTIDTIDGSYQGQYLFDKPHGKGSMYFNDSSIYSYFDGNWIAGKFFDGFLMYKNGDSFEGSFKIGRRYLGKLTFANVSKNLTSKQARK